MKEFRNQRGSTLMGVFIGLVIGVLLSFVVVWVMNKSPVPFREQGARTERSADNGQPGKVEPLPGKPGDKIGNNGDKPRFEFYKILPGSQEAAPTPQPKADAKGKPAASQPLWLQVGSFQKPAEADNLKAKLALIGLDAGVQEVDLPEKGVMYRVRTGPFSSVEEMNRARELLSQNSIQATQVKDK